MQDSGIWFDPVGKWMLRYAWHPSVLPAWPLERCRFQPGLRTRKELYTVLGKQHGNIAETRV